MRNGGVRRRPAGPGATCDARRRAAEVRQPDAAQWVWRRRVSVDLPKLTTLEMNRPWSSDGWFVLDSARAKDA